MQIAADSACAQRIVRTRSAAPGWREVSKPCTVIGRPQASAEACQPEAAWTIVADRPRRDAQAGHRPDRMRPNSPSRTGASARKPLPMIEVSG